eukprot:COSAG01_NODE_3688_length_5795_cov_2.922577_6_plen_92_part_00
MPVCWMVSRTVNYPFLQGLGLRTIVSLLSSAPVPDLCDFCKAHGIAHVPALWNASVCPHAVHLAGLGCDIVPCTVALEGAAEIIAGARCRA